ncbi:MAG TPA: restriction endonuclease subunit S [Thermoanaerobaculia bacterium]
MPMTDSEFATYRLSYGDVLLNEGQSIDLVGRCAMYRNEYPAPCAIQNQLVRFRAHDETSSEFASHLFRYSQHCGVLARIALQTTSVAHLGVSRFASLELPWPRDIGEQRAIGSALTDADALIESLEQLLVKKRQIKRGLMQELFTGHRRLPGFSERWVRTPLAQLADIRSGGTPATNQRAFWDGSIPWCTPTDITGLKGRRYLRTTSRTISIVGLQSSSAELIPARSVVMTSRATIGECAINVVPVTTNQGFKNLLPRAGTNVEFLYYLLCTLKQYLETLSGGSTFLEIGKSQLSQVEVLVPRGAEEQCTIAAMLSDMDDQIEALEERVAKTVELKQAMAQALLTGRIRLLDGKAAENLELVHAG